MGMSASQMRYILIAGRKSDVEFQGQQINQQRTTLATQSSALNTQLLNVSVPTPPTSGDYVKTAYTFNSNGEARTVVGTQYQSNDYNYEGVNYPAGTWIVNYTTDATTSQGKSTGTSVFSSSQVNGVTVYATSNNTQLSNIITNPNDPNYNATDVANISLICKDCGIRDANNRNYGDVGYVTPNFYKYVSGGVSKYVPEAALQTYANTTTPTSTYYVDDNATVTKSKAIAGAKVQWNENNRMTTITDAEGNEYTPSVTSSNDDNAYKDAFNEYEYKKAQYDKNIDDINSKIAVIASQDKKLELKLQDLGTQQKALDTEMEAVKKVIDKNVETTFKTFA